MDQGDITVWGTGTARTLRVHWLLHELGLEYQVKPIASRTGETQTPEYLELNPRGKIPALVDGDFKMVESAAIITYLVDTYGRDSGLVPDAYTTERAIYDQWCFFIMMELDAHTLYVMRRHGDLKDRYGDAPNAMTAAVEYFERQVSVVAGQLETSEYLLGNYFSCADILMTTCLIWAKAYQVPLVDNLIRYKDRMIERPAFLTANSMNRPK